VVVESDDGTEFRLYDHVNDVVKPSDEHVVCCGDRHSSEREDTDHHQHSNNANGQVPNGDTTENSDNCSSYNNQDDVNGLASACSQQQNGKQKNQLVQSLEHECSINETAALDQDEICDSSKNDVNIIIGEDTTETDQRSTVVDEFIEEEPKTDDEKSLDVTASLLATNNEQQDEDNDPIMNDANLLAERLKILKQSTSNSVGYLLPRNIQREQKQNEHVVQFDDESLFHCDFSISKM